MLKLTSAFVMTTLLAAAPALAHCGSCGTKETTTATKEKTCSTTQTVAEKSTCGDKATTVASKKTCGTEATTVASKKTCGTDAQTVASKKTCGSDAQTVASKKTCGTSAQTVADRGTCDKVCPVAGASDCVEPCSGRLAAGAPAMVFLVADQKTDCPYTAKKLAKEHDAKITYMVGDDKYCEKPAAMTAYAKALDKHLAGMTKVSFVVGDKETCCEKTAGTYAKKNNQPVRYRVAMVDFSEARQAREAAQRAEKAAKQVKMTYRVGDKSYACPMTAKAACSSPCGDKSAKPAMHFVVNDATTECSVTAKVMLLQAKINAAAEAATIAKTELEAPASAKAS